MVVFSENKPLLFTTLLQNQSINPKFQESIFLIDQRSGVFAAFVCDLLASVPLCKDLSFGEHGSLTGDCYCFSLDIPQSQLIGSEEKFGCRLEGL